MEPDTEIVYKVTQYYAPEHDRGILWNDPDLGIEWPVTDEMAVLSAKDRCQPRLRDVVSPFVHAEMAQDRASPRIAEEIPMTTITTLLVTGGAGFIGSAVIRHLLAETEIEVINADKLTYAANPDALAAVAENPRYHFERLDICDRRGLDRLFARYRPDAVMHLAAESHVDRSVDSPAAFIETNIVGTYTLLEASLSHWRRLPAGQSRAVPLSPRLDR